MDEIKILFVEDVPTDFELICRAIKKNNIGFTGKLVETEEDFIQEIREFSPDIILSDYSLPSFTGMRALLLRNEIAPQLPFILVTGSNNEEIAVDCMKTGADDYIIKDNLTRLGTAIHGALKKYEFLQSKKEAEDALSESEALFRTAFENASLGVCLVNNTGHFTNVNQMLCEMLGYSKEELMNLSFAAITHPDDIALSNDLFHQTKNGFMKKVNFEKRYIHKDGHVVWVNLFTTKVNSTKTNSNYFITYLHNITERKKAEEEIIKAKERAEESDRLKTAFLQNISHEIRTPMNAIVGFSSFLNDPELTHEKRQYFTDIIIQSSNQLLSIITDIITISTIEAGQEKIFESEVKLNSIMKLIYSQFIFNAQNKGIVLTCKTGLEDPNDRIKTDESKLESILTNLINNALKFTNQGSVEFGYNQNGSMLEFYVKDTGIGIVPEMHEEIFKRFRQVEITESRHFGGSGLGLSISKGYVELLEGRIWLNSIPGVGSAFNFTIPYRKIVPTNLPQTNLKIKNTCRSLNIIIAEDEDSNFEVLKQILLDTGVNIIRAENGLQVLDICRSTRIDVILMDIKMPEMDGLEATRQIQEMWPTIPVIAQSAYSFPDKRNQAIMAGCKLFMSKPINRDALIQAIKQVTGCC